jgi:uncharacterized repeat protein (TIGR03803 family)
MNRAALSTMLALLVACSQASAQRPLPSGRVSLSRAVNNSSACNAIFQFNGTDGAVPYAGLVARGGLLYGTTAGGGYGDGTLFVVTPLGQEMVVHNFYQEGDQPDASVTPLRKTLYGTTAYGGTSNDGTVFAIKTSGKVLWTYSFKGDGGEDGQLPDGAPIEVSGVLYGTTANGSTGNSGVVYAITRSGAEHVIYRFNGKQGRMPYGNLIEFGNTLWGTTEQGGTYYGTIFSITTSGKLTTIYKFKGTKRSDGENPYAGLVELNGMLYGTTEYGGANNTGTIFSITATGGERVIYSFGASSSGDGEHPVSALFVYNGNLYGTTLDGGPYNDGTVFEVTPSGTKQLLCSFGESPSTGIAHPGGSVVELNGELYGTAESGGSYNKGGVFSVSPNGARVPTR